MFSYDRGSGILFTCDAFGAHFCSEKARRATKRVQELFAPLLRCFTARDRR